MFVLFADATDAHSSEIYNAAVGDDSPSDRRRMACGLCSLFSFIFIIFLLFFLLLLDHVFFHRFRYSRRTATSFFFSAGQLRIIGTASSFQYIPKLLFWLFFFFYMPVRPVFIHPNEQRFLLYGDLRFPLPISFMDIMTRKWPLAKAVYIEHQVLYNSSTIIYILPRLSSSASSLSLSALFTHIRLILSTFSTLQRRPSKRPSKLLCILIWMANGWEDVVGNLLAFIV